MNYFQIFGKLIILNVFLTTAFVSMKIVQMSNNFKIYEK